MVLSDSVNGSFKPHFASIVNPVLAFLCECWSDMLRRGLNMLPGELHLEADLDSRHSSCSRPERRADHDFYLSRCCSILSMHRKQGRPRCQINMIRP